MTHIMTAHRQWASRPADERFTGLVAMRDHAKAIRAASRTVVAPTRRISAAPTPDNRGMEIVTPTGARYTPTHMAFGQIAALAAAPAGYLRTLPAPIAADCVNYGLQFERGGEDAAFLLQNVGGTLTLRAATDPRYGRIWNADILSGLVDRFGDGTTAGTFRVPGTFGHALEAVTRENTTLFAGDRDMFVFLADEENRIEIPNRRNGEGGSMARGFFVWNSEVGAATLGISTFLFDYVCANRIVWGATQYREIRVRHTASAPDRWLDAVVPAIESYAHSSAAPVQAAIAQAQAAPIDDLDAFLAGRFGKRVAVEIKRAHVADEGRPIETLWDAVTGATAYARGIAWQDERLEVERKAGEILDMVAA